MRISGLLLIPDRIKSLCFSAIGTDALCGNSVSPLLYHICISKDIVDTFLESPASAPHDRVRMMRRAGICAARGQQFDSGDVLDLLAFSEFRNNSEGDDHRTGICIVPDKCDLDRTVAGFSRVVISDGIMSVRDQRRHSIVVFSFCAFSDIYFRLKFFTGINARQILHGYVQLI